MRRPNVAKSPRLSAIVVNWNAGPKLACCVGSLLRDGESPRLDEVLVVDNASTDGSLDGLETRGPRLRVVQTGANLGFGRGVNRGVAATHTPYVLVLNPDVELGPGALAQMLDRLDSDPRAAVVGPRLHAQGGEVHETCGPPPTLAHEVCRKFLLHLALPFLTFGRLRPRTVARVGWVTGACFAVRRAAFDSVGGFDESIFMYYEDVDLCLRLRSEGWHVVYLPGAEGQHLGGGSARQVLEHMLVASEVSHDHVNRRHLGSAAASLLRVLSPVEMGLRSLLWGGLFVFSPNRREEARARLRAYRRILDAGGAPPARTSTNAVGHRSCL